MDSIAQALTLGNHVCWFRTPNGKYSWVYTLVFSKGDHVKIEVVNERFGESEWMWLLVESSDDRDRFVFGKLDSQPIVATDMHLGQELASPRFSEFIAPTGSQLDTCISVYMCTRRE